MQLFQLLSQMQLNSSFRVQR